MPTKCIPSAFLEEDQAPPSIYQATMDLIFSTMSKRGYVGGLQPALAATLKKGAETKGQPFMQAFASSFSQVLSKVIPPSSFGGQFSVHLDGTNEAKLHMRIPGVGPIAKNFPLP